MTSWTYWLQAGAFFVIMSALGGLIGRAVLHRKGGKGGIS